METPPFCSSVVLKKKSVIYGIDFSMTDCFHRKTKSQKASPALQNSSHYFTRLQQCCGQESFTFSSDFLFPHCFCLVFHDWSEASNCHWNSCHLHVLQLAFFKLNSKDYVFVNFFLNLFFISLSMSSNRTVKILYWNYTFVCIVG